MFSRSIRTFLSRVPCSHVPIRTLLILSLESLSCLPLLFSPGSVLFSHSVLCGRLIFLLCYPLVLSFYSRFYSEYTIIISLLPPASFVSQCFLRILSFPLCGVLTFGASALSFCPCFYAPVSLFCLYCCHFSVMVCWLSRVISHNIFNLSFPLFRVFSRFSFFCDLLCLLAASLFFSFALTSWMLCNLSFGFSLFRCFSCLFSLSFSRFSMYVSCFQFLSLFFSFLFPRYYVFQHFHIST